MFCSTSARRASKYLLRLDGAPRCRLASRRRGQNCSTDEINLHGRTESADGPDVANRQMSMPCGAPAAPDSRTGIEVGMYFFVGLAPCVRACTQLQWSLGALFTDSVIITDRCRHHILVLLVQLFAAYSPGRFLVHVPLLRCNSTEQFSVPKPQSRRLPPNIMSEVSKKLTRHDNQILIPLITFAEYFSAVSANAVLRCMSFHFSDLTHCSRLFHDDLRLLRFCLPRESLLTASDTRHTEEFAVKSFVVHPNDSEFRHQSISCCATSLSICILLRVRDCIAKQSELMLCTVCCATQKMRCNHCTRLA